MLNIALRAARRAAHLIRRAAGEVRRTDIYEKDANDFVTKTDQAAETVILDVLHGAYPDHAILAEESGALDGDTEWLWVVDPLDGTSNFIHSLPHFAVSIACLHQGRMEHAVILDVMRGEEFTASRGQGASCSGKRLRVSGCKGLQRALMATGTPTVSRQQEYTEQYFACLSDLAARVSGIRRAGSAALDLAWVAAGRLDAYWEVGLKPWDIAAGALLVQEAGGLMSDFAGGEDFLQSGNIVCGNLPCFRQLLPVVNNHLKDVIAAPSDSLTRMMEQAVPYPQEAQEMQETQEAQEAQETQETQGTQETQENKTAEIPPEKIQTRRARTLVPRRFTGTDKGSATVGSRRDEEYAVEDDGPPRSRRRRTGDDGPPRSRSRRTTGDDGPPRSRSRRTTGDDGPPRRRRAAGDDGPPRRRRAAGDDGPPRRRRAAGDDGPPRRRRAAGDDGPPRRRRAAGDDGPPRRRRAAGDDGPPRRRRAAGDDGPPRSRSRRTTRDDGPPRRRRAAGDDGPPRSRRRTGDDGPPRRRRAAGDDGPPRRRRAAGDDGPPRSRSRRTTGDDGPPRRRRAAGDDGPPRSRSRRTGDDGPPRSRRTTRTAAGTDAPRSRARPSARAGSTARRAVRPAAKTAARGKASKTGKSGRSTAAAAKRSPKNSRKK